jgi:hypothetical protein
MFASFDQIRPAPALTGLRFKAGRNKPGQVYQLWEVLMIFRRALAFNQEPLSSTAFRAK